MLYALHEAAYYAARPLSIAADAAREFWARRLSGLAHPIRRTLFAAVGSAVDMTRPLRQPDWRSQQIEACNDRSVETDTAWSSAWSSLRASAARTRARTRAQGAGRVPPVGHYATRCAAGAGFLQDTRSTTHPTCTARDLADLRCTRLRLPRFRHHVARHGCTEIGPGAHWWPCASRPAVLPAASADGRGQGIRTVPVSMIFIGRPIDALPVAHGPPTRWPIVPAVNCWFQAYMIHTVAGALPLGAARVYPGSCTLQLHVLTIRCLCAPLAYFEDLGEGRRRRPPDQQTAVLRQYLSVWT